MHGLNNANTVVGGGSATAQRRGRIFAVANQKGGVGKTTTAINLATAMASLGRRVLVIDLDPQGNASTGLGVDHKRRIVTTYHLLVGEAKLSEAVVMARMVDNLFVVPSNQELSGAEMELMQEADGRFRLRDAFAAASRESADGSIGYDYVFIDCPPSLSLLTINAFTAAHGVIAPLQCEYYALEGSSQLVNTIHRIRRNLNKGLGVQGVVMTMFDKRHKSEIEVIQDARSFYGDIVYDTVVPRNVKIAEAPSHGLPILMYDPKSPGAEAYMDLVSEVLERENDPVAA